jgi:hypothetical protein
VAQATKTEIQYHITPILKLNSWLLWFSISQNLIFIMYPF